MFLLHVLFHRNVLDRNYKYASRFSVYSPCTQQVKPGEANVLMLKHVDLQQNAISSIIYE